MTGKLIFKELQ